MSRSSAFRPGIVVAIAAAVLGVGAATALRPGLVLDRAPQLRPVLEAIDPPIALLVLILLLVLVAPTLGIRDRLRARAPEPLATDDGGDRSDDGPPVVGERIDRHATVATDYEGASRDQRESARSELAERLRPIAAEACAGATGRSYDDALEAVETGEWTTDPRAAAFLAGEDGPSTPLSLWAFDLCTTADPFSRALERTIDEIDAVQSTPGVRA